MSLVATRKLSANFIYNLMGMLLPLVLTLTTTPVYLRHIGQARFGVISIVWVLVGYFGFLDLGLSRASANRLAQSTSQETTETVFWTSFWTSLTLGSLGGAALYFVGNTLLNHFLTIDTVLRDELLGAFPWICFFIPAAIVNGVFVGALESRDKFLAVNIVAVIGTALSMLAPLITALYWSNSLTAVLPAAIIGRFIALALIAVLALRSLGITKPRRPKRELAGDLLGYGGWILVSSVVGTLMMNMDQFFIGAALGASAVAHYAVPFNIISRISFIPSGLLRALFPTLSRADSATARHLEYAALVPLCIMLTVCCVGLALTAEPLISWWINPEFADIAAPVAVVLAVGTWFNGLANLPYWSLQAQNQPQKPAKLHLIESVPYLILLWFLLGRIGLIGAALAWAARNAADAFLLFFVSGYSRGAIMSVMPGAFLLAMSVLISYTQPTIAFRSASLLLAMILIVWWCHVSAPTLLERFKLRFGISANS